MGDIHVVDLADFHSIAKSRTPDSGPIENQMDLLAFLVNYTSTLWIILSEAGPGPQIGWRGN